MINMFHLINPSGRIVVVDTMDEFDKWKNTEGFREPKLAQIRRFQFDRQQLFMESQEAGKQLPRSNDLVKGDLSKGVYLRTVSQGGTDGYSNSSRLMVRELRKLGIPVSTKYEGQKIGLLYHNPYSLPSLRTKYKILFTMFESDKLPDDWHEPLQHADKILVPSKWCQSVFKKAGFDAEVVNLGYDDVNFNYISRPNKREKRETFTFLHYNAFNIRKGFPEVLKAFVKEFDKKEPVKMVFKSTLDRMPIPILKAEYPNIDVILGKVSDNKLAEIIEDADCFVFPSRGEGFGMTPLEAMATGLPTIVPNAHGISEYFNSDYMYEVKVDRKCGALYSRYKGQDVGKMVICDVAHLRAQMRFIYEHEHEAKRKGKMASEYVKKYNFKNTADKLISVFKEVLLKQAKEPKIGNILILERAK